jgi:hypothetical protein
MSEQTETIQVDDKELFQGAMAPEPTQEQKTERERDEKGRFVAAEKEAQPEAKQPEPQEQPKEAVQAQPEQAQEQKDEANVPSWRLREVREAREAAERRAEDSFRENANLQAQLRQMQEQLSKLNAPKQEPVDFFADPDKAISQHLSPIEQRLERAMQDMTLRVSRTAAIAQHGVDAVAEMEKSIADAMAKNNPEMAQLAAQMRASDDPAGIAMAWHKRTKLMEATGGDLDGYKSRLAEDLLKDPKFLEKALETARAQAGAQQSRTVINLPPSLNRTPGSGNSQSSDDGDMSDQALFKHAMGRK